MKAFVTGGTGFIGSHLVDHLVKSTHYEEVRCLIRSKEKWIENQSFTRIHGNLHDLDALRKGVEDVDVIYHLAGLVKAKTWAEFERSNVDATENLLRVAQKHDVRRIVILSSLAAAGPSDGTPLTEDDPMNPVSMYGESKKQMELRVREVVEDDTSVTILRPAVVYGPRDDDLYTIFKLASYGICPIIGDGNQPEISMVYVDDVVQCTKLAGRRTSPGISTYFVANRNDYSWNYIRQLLSEVMDKKNIPLYIKPHWVKKLAGFVEKMAALTNSYPIINRDKANELILEWTCSIEKARKELNYDPNVTLEEGFTRTTHWYKLHRWL